VDSGIHRGLGWRWRLTASAEGLGMGCGAQLRLRGSRKVNWARRFSHKRLTELRDLGRVVDELGRLDADRGEASRQPRSSCALNART
jgi:hypothetical protein